MSRPSIRYASLRRGPRYHEPDWWLLTILLTLVMFGTVMIYSASFPDTASEIGMGQYSGLLRQVMYAAAGMIGLIVAMRVDYHRYRHMAVYLMGGMLALLAAMILVPGLATDVLAFSPRSPERDLYGFDGPLDAIVGVLTLHAGPWQFNILGFFIAVLALTPLVLAALARGWWLGVLATSVALYLVGRQTGIDVLPSQSERPFGLLVWQILFVPGLVVGWHRREIGTLFARYRGTLTGIVAAVALVAIYLRLYAKFGFDPLGLLTYDAAAFDLAHFNKGTLDPLRLVTMTSLVGALYLALRRVEPLAERVLGPALLPLGRNSFYVFIVHVFLSLAVASVPMLAGDGVGPAGNALLQIVFLAGLWLMARRGVFFRWIPR